MDSTFRRCCESRDANHIAINPPGQHFRACRQCDVQQNALISCDANPTAVETGPQQYQAYHECDMQQNFCSTGTVSRDLNREEDFHSLKGICMIGR
jgi:hypothetical protein